MLVIIGTLALRSYASCGKESLVREGNKVRSDFSLADFSLDQKQTTEVFLLEFEQRQQNEHICFPRQ